MVPNSVVSLEDQQWKCSCAGRKTSTDEKMLTEKIDEDELLTKTTDDEELKMLTDEDYSVSDDEGMA